MADDPMLGLFDSDATSFLDELTDDNDPLAVIVSQSMSTGMSGNGPSGMMGNQTMTGQDPAMMGGAQQQMYPQMSMDGGTPFNQSTSPQQQSLQHYNQYNAPNMPPQSNMAQIPSQSPRMMSPPPPQQSFGSPPPGSPRLRAPGSTLQYQGYNVHNGARMPTPQQQVGMMSSQRAQQPRMMWNQGAATSRPPYMNQQPSQQGMSYPNNPGMSSYLSQNAYPGQQPQRLSHFPQQSATPGSGYNVTRMGSPPAGSRLGHMNVPMGSPGGNMNMNQMSGGLSVPGQPGYSQGMRVHQGVPGQGGGMHIQQQGFNQPTQSQALRHNVYPNTAGQVHIQQQQQQRMNSGPSNKLQHYPYVNQQGNQNMMTMSGTPGNMGGAAPPLSHFPNQSPTHQGSQYPGNPVTYGPGAVGGQLHPTPSPGARPTPSPQAPPRVPSAPLSHPPSVQTQGNFGQSSLQQLEQLLPPHVKASTASTNPYQISNNPANTSMGMNPTNNAMGMNPLKNTVNTMMNPANNAMGMNPASSNMGINPASNMGMSAGMPSPTMGSATGFGQRNFPGVNKSQQPQGNGDGMAMVTVNTSMGSPSIIPQRSPNMTRVAAPGAQQPQQPTGPQPQQPRNIAMEINQLQQQIQQLYGMNQTPGTQQQMLDLQERVRTLRAQHQQQVLQQQRQKQSSGQQVQQQMNSPMMQQMNSPLQQMHSPMMPSQTGNMQPVPGNQPMLSPHPMTPKSEPSPQISTSQPPTPLSQPPTPVAPPQTQQQTTQSQIQGAAPNNMTPQIPQTVTDQKPVSEEERQKLQWAQQQQDKANKIIEEAIAKAQAEGKTLPPVKPPSPVCLDNIPTTVNDDSAVKKPKKKSYKKKKSEKSGEEKEKKVKKEKVEKVEKEKKPKEKKPKTPKVIKPKTPGSSKKKKPPATFIQNKKKRKRTGSDASDMEMTPPPSPDDEFSQKRRSARNTKRKKYLDDLDLQLSEDENNENQDVDILGEDGVAQMRPVQFFLDNPAEDDAVIVEKILGMRTVKRKILQQKEVDIEGNEDTNDEEKTEPETEEIEIDVEEFYVKYKNFSYLHCEWRSVDELKDKRIHSKIKRYKMKRLQQNNYFTELDEDELFNQDYVEVDRVLCKSVVSDPSTEEDVEITHYLVKWRSLPYEDSTWELEVDVDRNKIKEFDTFNMIPSEEERERKELPDADDYEHLKESPVYKNDNSLREYQLEGVNWLRFCWHNNQNCILADEMGLGKTIQSITFLHSIWKYGIRGPFLVIAPLSTIANWQREFETWTDMNVVTYHGTSPSRSMIQEYEMYFKDENGVRVPNIFKFHAMITTYEIIISDCELLSNIEWRAVVIDEAHRLKNRNCKLLEGLKMFDMEHKTLLTGTPLQNNVDELFSLLNFLEPKRFNSSAAFLKDFGDLQTEAQVEKLKEILKPMMLRRLKEDVEKNLAPKEETIIEVELTNIQKKYYRAILEKNFTFLKKGSGTTTNVPNLLNTMMELRKCCNHPYLLNGAEDKILQDLKCDRSSTSAKLMDAMIQSAGKLVLIDKLLPKLKAGGHKVLVFSQMIRVLDILEDYLINRQYLYERLDGRIRGNLRQEAIDRFSKPDSDRFVFLLCTRAGGLGINLTAADTVIIFDSDWNPQNDLQAQARCHRIGQSKHVKVYRLITRNSYEREMFDKASLKLGLDKAVLQNMAGKELAPQQQLSKREIEDLLKKGAYGAVMDDDNEGDEFCEEDIDQILQRRTKVIQIESEGKGSTFSKASFNVSGQRNDIDINDPNFWQKWAKKADLDVDELNSRNDLIIEMPRQRKQTARYGNQNAMLDDMSELESSSDSDEDESKKKGKKGKPGRRGRRRNDEEYDDEDMQPGVYGRAECFRVEKNVLVYGWGRWEEIARHGRFKRKMTLEDIQNLTRAILLYSLKHYHGDEKIKGFIYDLVRQPVDSAGEESFKNHSGLSAPVPRGRKGKKSAKKEKTEDSMDLSGIDMDPDAVLKDEGYKKHLHRHSNKVLLRVRLLYYLRQEVIGEQATNVFGGVNACDIDIPPPCPDGEPPIYWWDEEADKSLLIGTFKHGYEKYALMRQDPALCFLGRCGPPDGKLLLAEQNDDDDNLDNEDPEYKPTNASRLLKAGGLVGDDDEEDELSPGTPYSEASSVKPAADIQGALPFPGPSELNTRLRRVITGYQRNHKREQLKIQQKAKKMEKREKLEQVIRERQRQKIDMQQRLEQVKRERQQQKIDLLQNRWSRREEADFYRTVSTFGVEYDRKSGRYKWETFRSIAKLDKKYDDTMTEYYLAFVHMCKRVCRRFKDDKEARPPSNLYVEPISEERASRCLARIELLNRIREEILWHPKLDERLKMCQMTPDLPEWWQCGTHDLDLLIGAAKHGLARTDYHILHDPKLCFKEILQKYERDQQEKLAQIMQGNATRVKDEVGKETISLTANGEMELKKEPKKENKSENKRDSEHEHDSKSDIKKDVKTEDSDTDVKPEVKAEPKHEEEELKQEGEEIKQEEERLKQEGEELKQEVKEEKDDDEIKEEKNVKVEDEDKKQKDVKSECKQEETDDRPMPVLTPELGQQTPQFSQNEDTSFSIEMNTNDSVDMFGRQYTGFGFQWPKDRVVFGRLENVCHCIERGEWPVKRYIAPPDSLGNTPVGTPRPETPGSRAGTPDSVLIGHKVKTRRKYMLKEVDKMDDGRTKSFKVSVNEGDGLKMTIQRGTKRRRKQDLSEIEKAAKLRDLLAGGSDSEYQSESSLLAPSESSLLNGSKGFDFEEDMDTSLERKVDFELFRPRKKRGRKSKAEKLAEQAAAAAAAMALRKAALEGLDPKTRIPVINMEDGNRLSGDEAPMKKDLEAWLAQNPGYMMDPTEFVLDEEVGDKRRYQRRAKLDPTKLDVHALTGEENVSVINRDSGKKITGAKAPPLKYLTEWLEKNPDYDVDPKWAHIVKQKAKLPDKLKARVMSSAEKRQKRTNNSAYASLLSSDLYPSISSLSSLAAGYPKYPLNLPFGGLPGLGIGGTMLGMPGFGLGLSGVNPSSSKGSDADSKSDSKSDQSKSPSSASAASSAAASFPFLYNPLLYNPLFAQLSGGFSLPTNIPTSFATLAQAGYMNGLPKEGDTEEVVVSDEEQTEAQDLSMKKTPKDDESVIKSKRKDREHRHHRHKNKTEKRVEIVEEAQDLSIKKKVKHNDNEQNEDSEISKNEIEEEQEGEDHGKNVDDIENRESEENEVEMKDLEEDENAQNISEGNHDTSVSEKESETQPNDSDDRESIKDENKEEKT